ncbi:MAG TPA: ATP-binding protein [Thermoanaerobaculia bacterium]|nr:ATP-binding protein [Thermoanaerobaculia bacterium]
MRPAWKRYGAACLLVLAAFSIKLLIVGRLGEGSPVLLLPFGTILAAWYGGLGPGLLATGLSLLLAGLFFLDPADTGREHEIQMVIAALQGVVISLMVHLLRRATSQAVEARSHAEAVDRQRLRNLERTEEELRAAKEEAERARAEAEAANRLKDQFLATLSHELRGPVHAIAGWTQILRSGQLDAEKRARAIDVIERNAQAQAQLIGDLLDISSIISGKLRLDTRPVYPVESIEAAVAAVLPAAEAQGVRVERSLDAGAGPVLADPDRLQQIVVNLLGNAVKFTPRGGWVEARLEEEGGEVRIQVRDSGEGIGPELLPHVFDSFRQADASTTRRQGGLGLGLAIVHQLVELHGGSVSAASPGQGQGSVFTVTLPLLQPREATRELPIAVQPAGAATPSPPLAGLRVLAVEDDESTLDALTELLSLQGADVAPAASVSQALETLEGFDPDVLVSDIGMPERDGYELIREVRALGHDATDLPAVAVTAFASPEDRQRALAAGFQVHLAKPVDPRELTSVIAALAGR